MVCHGAVVVFACEGWNVVKYVRVFFAQCSSRAEEIENINEVFFSSRVIRAAF